MQTYSFVLTSTDSKWRFGFCRHDAKSDTAMVIITYLPWHDTFLKFLNVLGDLRQNSPHEFQPLLTEAYNKGVPEPGASLKLFYVGKLNENDVSVDTFSFKIANAKWDFNFLSSAIRLLDTVTEAANTNPKFHLPASVTIPIAQHPGELQFEFILQFCRTEEYDCIVCSNAGRTSHHIHITTFR